MARLVSLSRLSSLSSSVRHLAFKVMLASANQVAKFSDYGHDTLLLDCKFYYVHVYSSVLLISTPRGQHC